MKKSNRRGAARKSQQKKSAAGRRIKGFGFETLEDRRLLSTMPFTPGDLVVYRVGTGSGALGSTATAVFLDEYSPTGTLVQSIAASTADSGSTHILTAGGTATSEGELNLSPNGQFLTLTGYDACQAH